MAQKPYFYLSLTDGDLNHAPNQEEMQQGYQRADQHGLAQKALANLAREMMKNAEGGKIEKGESENIVFALRYLPLQRRQTLSKYHFQTIKYDEPSPLSFECVT